MLQHPPRAARSLSVHLTRLFATVAVATCIAAGSAHAQAPFAIQAPLPYAAPQADLVDPTKNIYHWNGFAPDPNVPVEWEVLIQNPNPGAAVTVEFADLVNAGFNGNNLTLICPATLLPPGVDPVNDVDCDVAGASIWVRNILIPPCGRVYLRYQTAVGGGAADKDVCNGGTLRAGSLNSRTQTPLPNQTPSGPDTCIFVAGSSRPAPIPGNRVLLHETVIDENGPPLLPGDKLLYSAALDLSNITFSPDPTLGIFRFNGDGGATLLPLPPFLDFDSWVDKPLAAKGALYKFDPIARTLDIEDPDWTFPPQVPTPWGVRTELGKWRLTVGCDAPPGLGECVYSDIRLLPGGNRIADDPRTYDENNEVICVVPVPPDFRPSTKSFSDADLSGDAQPGEALTLSVNVLNATSCPPRLMACECGASNVEVIDTVDLNRLQNIVPLNGGTLIAPDTVRWVIPYVGPKGSPPATVQFQARALPTLRAGDTICNRATITSDELKNVADGGISNCSTATPVAITLSPCINVRIPPGPSLVLEKTIDPPLVPPATGYPVGSVVTVKVTVTNVGGGAASNVKVWDELDPAWGNLTTNITPLNGGTLCTVCTPPQVQWTVGALAAGASATVSLTALIPKTLADRSVIPNIARTNSTQTPAATASNLANVVVCTPILDLQKTLAKSSYNEGEPIEWVITLKNTGSCDATGLTLRDTVDLTRLEDTPTLAWLPASGNYASPVITWNVPNLAGNGSQALDFRISSRVKAATAPGQVCDQARLTWDQGIAELLSGPSGPTCAGITNNPCTLPLPKLDGLVGAKAGTGRVDAAFSWPAQGAAKGGYDVYRVTDKRTLAAARKPVVPPVVGVCVPTAVAACTDVSAVPPTAGTLYFYQGRVACGSDEGE